MSPFYTLFENPVFAAIVRSLCEKIKFDDNWIYKK